MYTRILSIMIVLMLFAGCLGQGNTLSSQNETGPQVSKNITTDTNITVNQVPDSNASTGTATIGQNLTNQSPATAKNKGVLMLGRSVTRNWMDYLGAEYVCDDPDCNSATHRANLSGYQLINVELSSPPDIADSAISAVDTYGNEADTVFFKLCFVDFESDESGSNLAANEGYVQKVYDEIVTKRHKKLIMGNALPKVKGETDSALVANHKAYNAWLNNFASTHSDIKVLDLYGTVSESDGSLKSSYAVDSEDSHLNSAAYAQITPKFLSLLES